jgi:hypothetical protein
MMRVPCLLGVGFSFPDDTCHKNGKALVMRKMCGFAPVRPMQKMKMYKKFKNIYSGIVGIPGIVPTELEFSFCVFSRQPLICGLNSVQNFGRGPPLTSCSFTTEFF